MAQVGFVQSGLRFEDANNVTPCLASVWVANQAT